LKKASTYIIAGILLFAIGWAANFNRFFEPELPKIAKQLAHNIGLKKEEALREIEQLNIHFETKGIQKTRIKEADYYASLFLEKGIVLTAYEDNELIFWSDNCISFDYLLGPGIPEEQYLLLENGWYGLTLQLTGGREYYAFFLIKTAYPYHNQFLNDQFQKDFKIDPEIGITLSAYEHSEPVIVNGGSVFHIFQGKGKGYLGYWINLFLLFFGAISLIIGLEKLILLKAQNPWWLFLFPPVLIILRFVSIPLSNKLSELRLFDPALYASSSMFSSLGDLFINSLLLVYLAYFSQKHIAPKFSQKAGVALSALLALLLLTYGLILSPLIIGLIENSSINFNLSDVFDIDVYSVIGVTSIGLLLYSFFLFAATIIRVSNTASLSNRNKLLVLAFASGVHLIIAHFLNVVDLKLIAWPIASLALVAALLPANGIRIPFLKALLLLFVFSGLSWYFILKYEAKRERQVRIAYAEKLASDEDPVTELLFLSVEDAIQNDSLLHQTILRPDRFSNEILSQQIANAFIDRYWNKYNISIQIYKPDSSYWGVLPDVRPTSFEEFSQLIEKHGFESTSSPNLYHLYNYPENLSYLAKIPITSAQDKSIALVIIGFQARIFPDEIGYPELLIEETSNALKDPADYSFARYVDNKLIASQGEYNYRIVPELYDDIAEKFAFEEYNNFSHLVHRPDDRTVIVVSKSNQSFFEILTVFSYLFAFYGLLLLVISSFGSPGLLKLNMLNDLNMKIQFLSAGIILTTLLTFGLATRFYAERQFKEKNYSVLSEKTQSILIELEAQHKKQTALTPAMIDQISSQLRRLSYVFFTDINVYNSTGELVATSQPKIFESGLIAPRMNPRAYVKININHKSDYVQEERIGSLKHLSAYVPFRNENNDILAYVNLPYFARQDALEQEISRLIVTIVNIFVLLFALSIIAAIFISDWITRPLQLLQTSLSRIELGKQNESIEYAGSDVIGELVKEYNRKVKELEYNAEQLARSERESAWREMAKQVAHEIKNPLTPMKLNLQLLQKAVADGADDLEQRFERTSRSLIEQIDTLTQIANEFSNFANMPRAEFEQINLHQLAQSVVDLYSELPNQQVVFNPNPNLTPIIRADYKQLSRALQNLIKNGLQAAQEGITPVVTVAINQIENTYLLSVTDNGVGIPDEMRSKIFQPNFTTKSTGMGLGLAMVKNIIQNMNGKIWFEDAPEKGTIFFIEMPLSA
jgi:two-component system, NtrC family, nitrogen regulation sensor histidine kinase NtrY